MPAKSEVNCNDFIDIQSVGQDKSNDDQGVVYTIFGSGYSSTDQTQYHRDGGDGRHHCNDGHDLCPSVVVQ